MIMLNSNKKINENIFKSNKIENNKYILEVKNLKKFKISNSSKKLNDKSISKFLLRSNVLRKVNVSSYEIYPRYFKNNNIFFMNKKSAMNKSMDVEEISYKIHHNLHENSSNLFIDTLHLTSVLKILDNNYSFYSNSIDSNINSWCLAFFLFDKYYEKTNELYISFEILLYLIEKSKYFKKQCNKSYQNSKSTKLYLNNDKFKTRNILSSTIWIEKK